VISSDVNTLDEIAMERYDPKITRGPSNTYNGLFKFNLNFEEKRTYHLKLKGGYCGYLKLRAPPLLKMGLPLNKVRSG
jgi:hypothetical protein